MPRVLATSAILVSDKSRTRAILEEAGFDIVFPPPGVSLLEPESLIQHLEGIDAVVAGVEPFTPEVLSRTRLRVIARTGVGYDAIDVPAATERNVVVTTTPGTNDVAVAEHALALILGVMRGFPGRHDEVRRGTWRRAALPRLMGRTLGLVGLGRIGRAMVPRARGLGLAVIAFDPAADHEFARRNQVRLCDFDTLLAEADIVSLHLPHTSETENLINAASLAKMKQGAVLINTSRGGLVDEDALCDALQNRKLMAAGLDVFKVEPLPKSSPLLSLDNVLLTPHMAGRDQQSEVAMCELAARCIVDLLQGRWPAECVVNDALRSGWQW